MRLTAAALIAGTALLTFAVHDCERPSGSNVETLDALWREIASSYVDRSFNGLDWPTVRATYRYKAAQVTDRRELYWTVLRPMTALLESSHTTVSLGSASALSSGGPPAKDRNGLMEVLEPALGRCFGLWIVSARSSIAPQVVRVSSGSRSFGAGIRPGWRILRVIRRPSPGIVFLDRAGREHVFGSRDAAEMDLDVLWSKAGFAKLYSYDADGAAPDLQRLRLADVDLALGRLASGPEIALIDRGSIADEQRLDVGDQVISLSAKHVGGDELASTGRFRRADGSEHVFDASRACPPKPVARAPSIRRLSEGGYVLSLDDFREGTFGSLDRATILSARRIVLDLRRNVGGSSVELSRVLGLFLPPDTPLGRLQGNGRSILLKTVSPDGSRFSGPLVVLTSGVSASAAEVAADVLKRRPRTWVVGRRTAGEVQLSNTYGLPDGGMASIAVEEFRTVDGSRLERVGVKPTIDVAGLTTLLGRLSNFRLETDADSALGMGRNAVARRPTEIGARTARDTPTGSPAMRRGSRSGRGRDRDAG